MDKLTLDDKIYVSSKQAAKITGYAKDYIGQLCREGRVEARLVGRNWYVLETSIREHRFGLEKEVTSLKGSDLRSDETESTWKQTLYSPEPSIDMLPVLPTASLIEESHKQQSQPEESNAVLQQESKAELHENSIVVKEMQSAWQDWFSRTNELKVSKETLLENQEYPEIEEKYEDIVDFAEESPLEKDSTPIFIEKINNSLEIETATEVEPVREAVTREKEEFVPIHRSFASVTPPQPSATRTHVKLDRDIDPIVTGRVIRERRVVRSHSKGSSGLIKALFLLIGLLAIAITLVGTGTLDSFFASHSIHNSFIQYLGGKSSLIKSN